MAQVLAILLLLGAALALITPVTPHAAEIDEGAHVAIGLAALVIAAFVWRLGERLPVLAFQAITALGTLLVTLSIYSTGSEAQGGSENELFYLWPILYSGYFFGRRALALQLGVMAVSYAALLVAIDAGDAGVGRWISTVVTLAAAAIFVDYLRQKLDRDISLQQATLESTTDGILVVDENGRWVSLNHKFIEMWRIPPEITDSRDDDAAIEFVLGQLEDPAAFIAKVRDLYERPEAESFDQLHFKDGRIFERYSQPQRVDGRSVGRVWSFRDVTEQKRAEERLQHQADHDSLTDLCNRRRFEEELTRETARSERYRTGGALLLLDLDDFKGVNDAHGHLWGDEVLRGAARLLRSRVRSTDVLARLGGDEFALLLPDADEVRAEKLAEEILEVFRKHTIQADGGTVQVTTSIGVVALQSVSGLGLEPMVAADTAMYRAKREGRDRLAVYSPTFDSPQAPPQMRPRGAG
jgi:diguanylate cyclase (GGDEF)-like protein